MHLKSLQIVGFKSFADKTALEFIPGMTAIVGPNGCGKSNVSDAIRWVLGEQSARMLRGTKMEDCIFNGTDSRKPLSMAEVSITFANCEGRLETEYHEVTITRRVFRSGEGQYFINKTPCRLKDIQRLFLGTGIGTSSYSFMQQGRIDQVLSSRPEDRRTIFEEASGITKFKADKKEAIRKLEQTEANLLRLSDVIREVHRQIGSLQRQASKAQRYKVLYDELRSLDIRVSRDRLTVLTADLQKLAEDIQSVTANFEAVSAKLESMTADIARMRDAFSSTEEIVASLADRVNETRNNLSKGDETLRVNTQRVRDYQDLAQKTQQEIVELTAQLEDSKKLLATFHQDLADTTTSHSEISTLAESSTTALKAHLSALDAQREDLRKARSQLLEAEGSLSRLQNALGDLDVRQRSALLQRERLAAEKSQLTRVVKSMEEREQDMRTALTGQTLDLNQSKEGLARLETQRATTANDIDAVRAELASLQAETAAKKATRQLLHQAQTSASAFTSGARYLLDQATKAPEASPKTVLGPLASFLDVDSEYRTALETVLRPWTDAVVVSDPERANEFMILLQTQKTGPVRLLPLRNDSSTLPHQDDIAGTTRLIDHVRCPDFLSPTLRHVLHGVLVAKTLSAIPKNIPPTYTLVTQDGALLTHDGWTELWMPDRTHASPLSTKLTLDETGRDLKKLEEDLASSREKLIERQTQLGTVDSNIRAARLALSESSQRVSQQEGQLQLVAKEATDSRSRLDTVSWELDALVSADQAGIDERRTMLAEIEQIQTQRQTLSERIHEATEELHRHEDRSATLQTQVADHRVRFAASEHKLATLRYQRDSQVTRIREIEASTSKRAEDATSHAESSRRLEADMESLRTRMLELQTTLARSVDDLKASKSQRDQQRDQLLALEAGMSGLRTQRDTLRDQQASLDIRSTELRFKHQTYVDRMASSYGLTLSDILNLPDTETPPDAEVMTTESMETRLEELRTKIEAMGPVNLTAIEEHQELEQRETFLTTQEQDLSQAKQQLMEMIRKINRTTSEMFRATFDQVNTHFQQMFETLFGGGSARLVLVDEEDVLECGIEIIARPPGKRLQNISLLSGGERTLTAVALLFAIYLIKPSPFCLLDELDAPLDETNIGRFVSLLREFLKQSQFVVITHNRQTISAADILYGVTMQEKGVSNIVSMRFLDRAKAPVAVSAPTPAPVVSTEPEPLAANPN